MFAKPCPCMGLQLGVKVVAGVEAVIHLLSSIFYIMELMNLDEKQTSYTAIIRPITIAAIIIYFLAFLVAIVLFVGALKNNVIFCRTWMGFAIAHRVLSIVNAVVSLILFPTSDYAIGANLDLIWILIEVYFQLVVNAFIKLIRQVDPMQINAEMGDATPSGAQLQPQPSAMGQDGAAPPQQPDLQAEVSPV